LNPEGYAELLKIANPNFVEVKAYMHIGYSRKRLSRDAMPTHSRVNEFAGEIVDCLVAQGQEYRIADGSEISRVVLISSKKAVSKLN